MITVQEQQDVANEVLVKLKHSVDNDAIIAGGAPRDWHFGKPARDVDIYLRTYVGPTQLRKQDFINRVIGEELTYEVKEASNLNGRDIEITDVLTFKYKGVEFQLIFCDPNSAYKKTFKYMVMDHIDVGLCRVYCDWYYSQSRDISKTGQFVQDERLEQLTVFVDSMDSNQLERCQDVHLPKLKEYFPHYKVRFVK